MFDGIDFNEAGALRLLEELDTEGMVWRENIWFSLLDSSILYGMLKKYDPAKMIEIGSGFSTGIARSAFNGELVCFDPQPRGELPDGVIHVPARVEYGFAEGFADCDLLFVDSWHVYEQGGDIPFIFLDILPVLKPGTIIHFHDIYLPDDYPAEWHDRHYDEQYVLGAFLENNPEYEVLWPGHLMVRDHGQKLLERLGVPADLSTASGAGSFWIRKRLEGI